MEQKKDDACNSNSPSRVPERLKTALARVAEADRCLDLTAAAWRPVASDHWEHARKLLAQARSEIENALIPWATS
jgi:hypothetical protein